MTDETRELFLKAASSIDVPASPYGGGYSGRGMMGQATEAVVVEGNREDVERVVTEMVVMTGRRFGVVRGSCSSPDALRVDNLGRDWVVY